ncbi:FAD-binding protein [Aquimarina intermedia]|uniref:FAD binding domain-containing protein n=1 Tax=Aquimarina intermedia TaxID=350814 RepID=A0A5S5CA95_9FLAO|nr:FAD-binding protein [Aquimarina intermedia]TYP75286.1 FAD binding domain-containing protein [Aquimarina intermedia]
MATTKIKQLNEWNTLHSNGPFPLKILYQTKLEGERVMPSKIERYNDAALEIQRLIKETKHAGEGFRAYGSAWSMNNIASNKDRMHFNGFMNISMPIHANECHQENTYDPTNLFLFECGNTIKEISETLAEHGKSLKTSGASNGQTIAGCVSTGVHGSGIDSGSVQDYVVGLNLIIGPNTEDNIFLEPKSKPVLLDNFVNSLNSRVIRDDDLFHAALVGLGSFGFIHGVVVEAEPVFLLKRYVKKIDKNLAFELANTMDFKNSAFVIPGESNAQGKANRPFHFKIFINQYSDDSDCVVEVMYKKPYQKNYPDPFPVIKESLYRDLIYLFVRLAENCPKSIPWLVKRLGNTILPEEQKETTGMLKEIFWDAPYQGPAFACSFGIHHRNSEKAMNLLSKLTREEGPIPGIFALRFVKGTKATLGFTKFPITCVIEIDGLLWKKTRKIMSLEEYSKRMIAVLKENNIPFTIHWGKNSYWKFPGLVNHMYGGSSDKWVEERKKLLSSEMQDMFTNKFIRIVGLD